MRVHDNGEPWGQGMSSFDDRSMVLSYAERTARIVPALGDMHAMTGIMLAETAPVDAKVLVLGAGGGMELKFLAQMHPRWTFEGVDPSAEMLDLARQTVGEHASRISFRQGYIDDATQGPFDAAACLLTLHFLKPEERLRTLQSIAARLAPGAPFVMAHYSFPPDTSDQWLARMAAYASKNGQPFGNLAAMKAGLPVLSPEQDVLLLEAAGFTDIELFYAALAFRGWAARKPAP